MSESINTSSMNKNSKSFIKRVPEIIVAILATAISLPFVIFFLMLSVLPAMIHIRFVEYMESHLKALSRSPRSVFILTTLLYWGVFLLIGFVIGQLKMKRIFLQAT